MVDLPKLTVSKLLIELIKDPDRKSIPRIIWESLNLLFYYKSIPRIYFSRYLFKKGMTNIKDYFPDDFLYYKLKPFFNNKEVIEVLENKLYFDFFYGQFNIKLPGILMYNHRNMFVVNKKCIEVKSASDFKVLLEEIFKQNPSYESIIIKKMYWSFGGDKVYKLSQSQFKNNPEKTDEIFSEVIKSGYLFQETIIQHPDLNRLNPSCLNTIRIDTFIDRDGKIDVISGYIRMSINNYHVDNISSGGAMVGIDIKTGKLKKYGYLMFRTYGVKVLTEHPETKTVFEDFLIPYFTQVKELVIKAAGLMPELRLVGWDVAIGESGPVMIEGNSDYDISGNDMADNGLRANPVFRKVLHEINYL
jgi:hypothetical protein